jgi:hypothetical protein
MVRENDMHLAYVSTIKKDSKGRQILTTAAFQKRLGDLNHVWTLQECNRWILSYQNFFELSTEQSENKTYALRNMEFVR